MVVTVTNSITRDQGYLKIAKSFDAKTSGFTGKFAVVYNCGAGDVTVNLDANTSTTVGPFDTGTSCTISEPTLPTAPTGWTFGTPSIATSPVTIVKGDAAAASLVTVTNTITHDQGYLKIAKAFDAKTSGFTGTFAIVYNCGAGNVTVNLAGNTSTTVGPFDTGTSCSVSEPTLPAAPTGWTFGTPSVSGSPAAIVKGDQSAAVVVTVTNSITRDQGYLKITKVFDPKASGFQGTFAIVYNCGGSDQTINLAAGASTTVGPFDTGTSCSVSEVTPAPYNGWTFATPQVSGSPAVIVKGTAETPISVTVTNTITQDLGYLKISKAFDAKTSGFTGTFDIVYNCGAGDVTVKLQGGTSTTVGPFATGSVCSVSEPALPAAPNGWTFGTPSVSGSPATINKGDQAAAVSVTVTNTITRDQGYLKISKVFDPKTSGFTGTFAITYNCGAGDQVVNIAAGANKIVGPFDTGTSCTVKEAAPAAITGWTWAAPVIAGSPATIVKGDQAAAVAVTVTNSITRDLGALNILKTLSNPDGAPVPASFAVNYDCGTAADGSTALKGSVNAQPGIIIPVTGIPTGNTCSVSEPTPAPIAGYNWSTPVISPASIVIANTTGTFTITVANEIKTGLGALTVTKFVDWAGADPIAGQTFTICIQGPSFEVKNCKTFTYKAAGDAQTWTNLLPGAYTVSENNPGVDWEVILSGSPATVVAGQTATATVTNKYKVPTAVELVYFKVKSVSGTNVSLEWKTASETDNDHYEIYRSTSLDFTSAVKVGTLFVYNPGGSTYTFNTTLPKIGLYYFWLVDVDTYGNSFNNGKVMVSPNNVYVPSVNK